MERPLKVNYTPSKNALVPKKCKTCHKLMEIKQINLTEAVRQCYKCSTPLQELDITDIEFFHRSYQDVNKNPADWSPNVSTEEAELNKLGSWIERFNLALDEYEETADDNAHITNKYSDFAQRLKDYDSSVKYDEMRSISCIDRDSGDNHLSPQGKCGWNIDEMEELDAALAKASTGKLGTGSLPFSLDDLLFHSEQEQPCQASSVSGIEVAVKSRVNLLSCHELSEQAYLSETSGFFLQGPERQESDSMSGASDCSFMKIGETSNNVEDKNNDRQTKFSSENFGYILEDPLAFTSADLKSDCSVEEEDQTRSSEKNDVILIKQEEGLDSVFEKSCVERDSLTINPGPTSESSSISSSIQNYNYESDISSPSTKISANDCAYDSGKKTDASACILSTATPYGTSLSLPCNLLTTEVKFQRQENLVYEHVCDCDDALLQLSPPPTATDNHCLDFELPPLFDKEQIIEANVEGEYSIFQSDVEKVVFSPIQLTPKTKCLSLRTSSRQPNLNSNTSTSAVSEEQQKVFKTESSLEASCYDPIESCPNILFTIPADSGTSPSDTYQNIVVTGPVDYHKDQSLSSHNILVTVPADGDITAGMLQSVSLDDLPILIGCSDGVNALTCPNDLQITQPVEEKSQIKEVVCSPVEDRVSINGCGTSTILLSSPLLAFEELCLDQKAGELNNSCVSHNFSKQSVEDVESMEHCFSHSINNTTLLTSFGSVAQSSPVIFEPSSKICNYEDTLNEYQNNRAERPVYESEGSVADDKVSTCHIRVDQPLRLFSCEAEDDDDELSSFTGAKFRPLAFRKTPQREDIQPQLINFFEVVKKEILPSSHPKKNSRKFH